MPDPRTHVQESGSHCARCRGLGKPAPRSPERNLPLEDFLRAWATQHRLAISFGHGRSMTTIKVGVSTPDQQVSNV